MKPAAMRIGFDPSLPSRLSIEQQHDSENSAAAEIAEKGVIHLSACNLTAGICETIVILSGEFVPTRFILRIAMVPRADGHNRAVPISIPRNSAPASVRFEGKTVRFELPAYSIAHLRLSP